MASTNTLRATFAYENTNETRKYDLDISEDAIPNVKEKTLAINASLAAGTAGGMSSFFVSDNGNHMIKISNLELISITETVLDLTEGSDA